MINEEDDIDVMGRGEETAEPVVNVQNLLREAAEPSQREGPHTAEQKAEEGGCCCRKPYCEHTAAGGELGTPAGRSSSASI